MKLEKTENTCIVNPENDDLRSFHNELKTAYPGLKKTHLILDLSVYGDMKLEDMLIFLKLSNRHRKAKKSFVLVNESIDIHEIPDELLFVPTIQEAHDMIEMEEMERDLGF